MDSDEKILKELTESSLKHKLPVESYPTTPRQPYNTSKVSKPKRKAHNKSRLGCQTCKRRRIKCDETRPICLKCQNLGLECGYEIEARAKTKQFPKENACLSATGKNNYQNSGLSGISVDQNNSNSINNANTRTNSSISGVFAESSPPAGFSHTLANTGVNVNEFTSTTSGGSSFSSPINPLVSDHSLGNLASIGGIGALGTNSGLSALAVNNGLAALTANGGLAALLSNGGLAALLSNGGLAALASGRSLSNFASAGGLSTLIPGDGPATLPGAEELSALGGLANLASRIGLESALNAEQNTSGTSPPTQSSAPTAHSSTTTTSTETTAATPKTTTIIGSTQSSGLMEESVLISATETIPGSLPSSSNIPPPLEDGLAMIDLRLLHHYNTVVWKTITDAGISDEEIWREDLPVLALDNPFLMHALLCFSATHLSRTVKGIYDQAISFHRLQAMSMLREAVKSLKPENTDPLVASSLLLIMESLANASTHSAEARSASAQAWIFHVRGAATILSAVWPLTPESRFYRLIGMDLRDLNNSNVQFEIFHKVSTTGLDIFDPDIADLYPVDLTSPYFPALAYLDKLQSQQNFPDFILRVFSFPALMDKKMGELLCAADTTARRILGAYCKFVLKYTHQMKDKIWFLEGLASVPRADIEVFGSLGLVSLNLPQIGILDEMMPDYDFNTFDVMDYLV